MSTSCDIRSIDGTTPQSGQSCFSRRARTG
ncbi:unnamed protein product, partial [Allacma fusca]